MTVAFVIPWYGENIPGGAEAECRTVAKHLKAAGPDVEILTTCARDFFDWSDFHKPGVTEEGGLTVRRFRTNKRHAEVFDAVNFKLIHKMSVSPDEERRFMEESINSDALVEFISANKDAYTFVFIPYMFGTTYFGALAAPGRSYLIPCAHDESYAHLSIFTGLFRNCSGIAANAQPEAELIKKLYGVPAAKISTIGLGIEPRESYNPQRFRKKFKIDDPFILYAGRKDLGKNTPLLVSYFAEYKRRNPGTLKLVMAGGGSVDIPAGAAADIIELGFLPEADKYDAHAAADLLCQPSENESFSIVIMDSWAAGVPVLVNKNCEVTTWHCRNSNGGLFFEDYLDFEGCVNFLLENPEAASKLAENGRGYVKENYDWGIVTSKYRDLLGL